MTFTIGAGTTRGRVKLNVAPRTGLFVAEIVPPCARTIERAIERPMPMPAGLVV